MKTQVSIVDNAEQELLDLQKADNFKYAKTNLISITMGNKTEQSEFTDYCENLNANWVPPPRMSMLYNINPFHVRPLANNIINNVLYGDDTTQIQLTNHPLVYNSRVIL